MVRDIVKSHTQINKLFGLIFLKYERGFYLALSDSGTDRNIEMGSGDSVPVLHQ